MKSKFQRKSKNSFSKAKKKGKSTKVLGKFISLPNENSWKVWSNEDYGTFNGSAKRGRRRKRKGQGIFILTQGRIENPAKSC